MGKRAAPAATVTISGLSHVKPSVYFKLSAKSILKQLATKRYVYAIGLPFLYLGTFSVKLVFV